MDEHAAVTSNAHHFVTTWRIPATPEEITSILGDAPALARWWPSVYLRVEELQPGDEHGLGKVVRLWTKGWLPYTLRWQFTVTQSDPPSGFRPDADGDFVGVGIWSLTVLAAADAADGPVTMVTYDRTVVAQRGVLKTLSFIMKPIFAANHHWAMRRGEESLRLEIARRHAVDLPSVRDAIPEPPGPTFPYNLSVGRPR